ncbi:hypothetical protein PUR59_17100 [Streptomyces sp. SP18ES09]|nr:hypothetical protein [Streptomyces sp. SP18ES09]
MSVLATDKTGTLTEGRMVVQHVWTPETAVDLTGFGYEPEGEVLVDGSQADGDALAPVRELLRVTALCNDAVLRPPDPKTPGTRWTAPGDPTEAALLTAATEAGCPRPM